MEDIGLISTGIYRYMNIKVGTESAVRMRRTIMDLDHQVKNSTCSVETEYEARYLSGSDAEGFRFQTSDCDLMYFIRGIRVIFHPSQLSPNHDTVLLAECEGVRPGYTRLRLLTNSANAYITGSCFKTEHGCYLSSKRWSQQFLDKYSVDPNDFPHGPCWSGFRGTTEFDFAHCIKSDTWPQIALGCIQRMRRSGWPTHEVLKNIVKQGSILVPLGSRTSRDQSPESSEWRISFALAEKILVHNMTHVQFLTFGLLKLVLKCAIEVNQEVNHLLCSYFLKTVLFWRITLHPEEWTDGNFLQNFWLCFQTLISFVISENCPNFFIPENNMFQGRIEGASRTNLLSHLTSLYREGYHCLLRGFSSEDVRVKRHIFQQPERFLRICTIERMTSKTDLDTELIQEVSDRRIRMCNNPRVNFARFLCMLSLWDTSSSEANLVALKVWFKLFFSDLSIMMSKQSFQGNRLHYKAHRTIIQTARISSTDTVHHLLCSAVALYNLGSTSAVIKILRVVTSRLENEYLMYPWNISISKYRESGGDTTPIDAMMRKVIAFPLSAILETCIPELALEHLDARQGMIIPPLVCANFLLFLCYQKEGNLTEANAIMRQFFYDMCFREGYHITDRDVAVSWQLLGICFEMSGDYNRACSSYVLAMQQNWCQFDNASIIRICGIILKLLDIEILYQR